MERTYLPEPIIEDCIQKIPKRARREDRELLNNSSIPKERQTELMKQWFRSEIIEQRRKDLEHYRHLLHEIIPRDLILEQASDLVKSWSLDSDNWQDDYDSQDETLKNLHHMEEVVAVLDTLAIAEKFERFNAGKGPLSK